MKTAMQELLDEFDNMPEYLFYTYLKVKRDELLEKEKEQIMFTYNDGVNDGNTQGLLGKEGNGNYVTLEEYYNQTYGE